MGEEKEDKDIPTAFSSMIFWALVFAADMAAEWVADERKKRDRNAMLGNLLFCFVFWLLSWMDGIGIGDVNGEGYGGRDSWSYSEEAG